MAFRARRTFFGATRRPIFPLSDGAPKIPTSPIYGRRRLIPVAHRRIANILLAISRILLTLRTRLARGGNVCNVRTRQR